MYIISQWARKFLKVQAKPREIELKKKSREIAILAVLNFFPLQKLIFGHFWNSKKLILVKKKNSWNWFTWFHEFFGLDFLKFSGPLCKKKIMQKWHVKKYFYIFATKVFRHLAASFRDNCVVHIKIKSRLFHANKPRNLLLN